MSPSFPLIPAEAGTQSFGCTRAGGCLKRIEARGGVRGSHWVPASAGMSGE
jgi:hypothetical protein